MERHFPAEYQQVLNRIESIDPIAYGKTRNYLNGSVTYLSPYLTHGVISTKQVFDFIAKRYKPYEAQKLIQELSWKEYFQAVFRTKGPAIWSDLKREQEGIIHHGIPLRIVEQNTDITALDEELEKLISTGYMHNHARMWLAALVCNHAHYNWREPSKWLYYHLLDGEISSNTLSWQWVAGAFSSKQYIANQNNINTYSDSKQTGTPLDVSYEELSNVALSGEFHEKLEEKLSTDLSSLQELKETQLQDCLVYHPWMLDPEWQKDNSKRRVLLFEVEHFQKHSISPKRLDFILKLATNIPDLEVYTFSKDEVTFSDCITREHPAIQDWNITKEAQDLIHPELSNTYFKGFFAFWKEGVKKFPGLK